MVSPHGAGFFVIRDGRTGEVATIDNYATVPLGAHAGMFRPVPGSLENETEDAENDVGYLRRRQRPATWPVGAMRQRASGRCR